MRRIRFVLAWVLAFLMRFRLLIAAGVVVGILFFLLSNVVAKYVFPKNISYVGVVGRYRPDELPDSILGSIGEGLTNIDENGNPQPGLAKSWKSEENGKKWVFEIDTSKRWHDGTNVSAESIQYAFQDVAIEKPDSETVVFRLQSPYAPFPSVVARPTFKKGLVGTGEWEAVNISVQGSYVDRLEIHSKVGEKKIFRFYPSEDTAKVDFKLGHVDQLLGVYDAEPFTTWNSISVNSRVDETRYAAVFFNNRSIFKDNKSLRQALAYAINKSSWVDRRALGPIPSLSWAYNVQVKPYDYDVKRAQELLKSATGKDSKVRITLTTNPQLISVAEKIAKDWSAIGVETSVSVASSLPENYDAFLTLYAVSLDPDQYLTWHSTQEDTNITHYSNARIDKLLEDGRMELDVEKRKKIYLDFQRFLLEDVPATFLYHPVVYTILRK